MAKDQARIRFFYDSLKGTEMVMPRSELVVHETVQDTTGDATLRAAPVESKQPSRTN